MDLAHERTYTIDDIYALPDGQRAELIDGQLYMMAPPTTVHQRLIARLCHHILSHIDTSRMDYGIKLFKYRTAGVREYWIVNPLKKIVQTYFFDGEEDSNAFLFEDEISAHIFTGLSIKISDLL